MPGNATTTLSDLLATRSLDLRLLTGTGTEVLRWAATSELADPSPFLEGAELLLTTGLRARGPGEWRTWVQRLAAAGVGAVGFGTGPSAHLSHDLAHDLAHDLVPAELLAAARATGLAVVEVPTATPFIAVTRRVAELVQRGEHEAELAAARTERGLAADAARDDGERRVLRRLAASLPQGAVWLVADDGTVLARAGAAGSLPAAATDLLDRVRGAGPHAASTDVSPAGTLLLRSVGAHPARWLVVRTGPGAARAARGTVGTAAALLDVLARRPVDDARREVELVAVALDLLDEDRTGAARRVLAALGRSLPDPLVVVRTSQAMPAPPPGSLAAGGRLLTGPDEVDAVLAAVRAAGLRAGVSGAVPAGQRAAADREATAALARTSTADPVRRSGDPDAPGIDGVLAQVAVREHARALLAPLERLPAAERDRLLDTARAFLAHHGQRQPTADALGVHRNTVRARVTHLEQLLGRSTASPDDRAELWLALAVRERERGS